MRDTEAPPTMRAAVIEGPGELTIRALTRPAPAAGEVLVRIEYCGVCGTDLHSVLEGWAAPGSVVGHEWSGQIEAVAPDVRSLHPGDLVVGGPPWCGSCEFCVAGRPSQCANDPLRSGGGGHTGAFAEYVAVPAFSVHRMPDALDSRTAALAEPLAVALHALTLARLPDDVSGRRALVSGAGPLGLLVVAALADRGVGRVDVAEPAEARRGQALAAGATDVLDPAALPAIPAMPTDCVPDGYDVVFETSGQAAAISTGIGLLRPTGTIVLLGTGSMSVRIDPIRILLNELIVTGAYCYDADGIDAALALLASGRLPIQALQSADDVSLDDLLDTMQHLKAGELSTKVMVRPHG
jgi:(R,R)-butanediol dehydrogenase/meso-butanediol dehydrogenase/diacetyl reductase